jgi:hypothetical protein
MLGCRLQRYLGPKKGGRSADHTPRHVNVVPRSITRAVSSAVNFGTEGDWARDLPSGEVLPQALVAPIGPGADHLLNPKMARHFEALDLPKAWMSAPKKCA